MSEVQAEVAAAVERRGYRKGWTLEQFAARQVAKLIEELDELAYACGPHDTPMYGTLLSVAAEKARAAFDAKPLSSETPFQGQMGLMYFKAMDELADVQVVVFALAEALSEITGHAFDVAAAARSKAMKDVKRGVRPVKKARRAQKARRK